MLQAYVITLREGIEAFLIVAVSISYLRKTGRADLVPPVYWAIAVSVLTSAAAAWLFSLASNQALWEGILATVAAILVATLVVQMWRVARRLKGEIERRLQTAADSATTRASWLGVFAFIVLMITREGMEMALLLGTLAFQMRAFVVLSGVVLGALTAAVLAWLWGRYGHRINLGRFLQVTAVFLLLFVAQLLIYGIHELSEANVLPFSERIHDATEPYGPDGIYGHWLSYALVAVPLAWLVALWLWHSNWSGRVRDAFRSSSTPAGA